MKPYIGDDVYCLMDLFEAVGLFLLKYPNS